MVSGKPGLRTGPLDGLGFGKECVYAHVYENMCGVHVCAHEYTVTIHTVSICMCHMCVPAHAHKGSTPVGCHCGPRGTETQQAVLQREGRTGRVPPRLQC